MKINNHTVSDIEEKIEGLAKSYTPEWHFDRKDPDIGSTIAHLFALQMKRAFRAPEEKEMIRLTIQIRKPWESRRITRILPAPGMAELKRR